MKARITLSLLFALLVASTPARADMLTGLLIDATRAVLTKATHDCYMYRYKDHVTLPLSFLPLRRRLQSINAAPGF